MEVWYRTDEDGKAERAIDDARRKSQQDEADEEIRRRVSIHRRHDVEQIGLPPKALEVVNAGVTMETLAIRCLVDGGSLFAISGNPGTGKTIAACKWLYDAGVGMFIKAARLSRWERYDDDEMKKLLGARNLVIDDLGTEFQDAKGNFMAILDEVIDVRYDYSRPTLLTTNLDADAFKERYGERIADRIRETGKFISLDGASMRGRA